MRKFKIKYPTNFLLPRNNFFIGMGSTLNIAGNYFKYNTSKTGAEADSKAIYSDWENTGEDIRVAIEKFKKSHTKDLCEK